MNIKEKFKAAKTKVKETAKKAKEKTIDFCDTHPNVIPGIAIVGAVIGTVIAGKAAVDKSMSGMCEVSDANYSNKQVELGDGLLMRVSGGEANKTDYYKSRWEEEAKEDFDKVRACASSLNMREGDLYVIETEKDNDGTLCTHVSQLKNWN